jgi:hypothetical protein
MKYTIRKRSDVTENGITFSFLLNMEKQRADDLIPEQQAGGESDTIAEVVVNTEQEALALFERTCQRLLNVNAWQQYAGKATASFKVCDAHGNEVERLAQQGDHFKIDIPGPGTITGEGFDWVQIEAIEKVEQPEEECLLIRVRPASNPNNERQDTAHFFTDEATSNFVVKRVGTTVTAEVHGRNEKPNTKAETVIDKARNAAVATGAITAFSKVQWKSLVNGLLKVQH